MGMAKLTVKFSDREIVNTKTVKFLFNIIDLPLTYIGIIGRPILYEIDAAMSIRWLTMKIPLEDRVITILEDQCMAQQCYQLVVKPQLEAFPLTSLEIEK